MTINTYQHGHKRGVKIDKCQVCKEQHSTHNPLPDEGGFMEKLSDLIGSTRGIWLLAAIEAVYMVAATVWRFDPYPFSFLTLVLSLIALQFSQIIIVVQNRQGAVLEEKAAKERQQVSDDYEMDQRSFALLTDLHNRLIPEVTPHDVVDIPDEVQQHLKDGDS
jgi:uncharacterized membrane protein